MGLFKDIKKPIEQVLDQQIFSDAELTLEVVYKKFVSATFDKDLGRNVLVYSSTKIPNAIELKHTQESSSLFGSSSDKLNAHGKIEKGDTLFMVRGGTLPDGWSLKDVLETADGRSFTVKSVDHVFGIVYSITVEGSQ